MKHPFRPIPDLTTALLVAAALAPAAALIMEHPASAQTFTGYHAPAHAMPAAAPR